jgi:hypothetical protein
VFDHEGWDVARKPGSVGPPAFPGALWIDEVRAVFVMEPGTAWPEIAQVRGHSTVAWPPSSSFVGSLPVLVRHVVEDVKEKRAGGRETRAVQIRGMPHDQLAHAAILPETNVLCRIDTPACRPDKVRH